MDVVHISLERTKARELYRAYKAHAHHSAPLDREIRRTYQHLAQGKVVIKALESIAKAGSNEEGLPRLAIARASAKACHFDLGWHGDGVFYETRADRYNERSRNRIAIPENSFATGVPKTGTAIIPPIPLHLRPKRGLANYHILWEADWKEIPVDPYLLRRIGKGDMWLVCAAWDLTDVERAALASRL